MRASDRAFGPQELWTAIRKRLPAAIAVTVAVFLGMTFYTLGQKKIYRASTTLQIDPNPPQPLGKQVQTVVDLGAGNYWSNKEYYETQFKVMQSHKVASQVVRTLGLQRDPAFLANSPAGTVPPPAEVSVDSAASALRGRLTVEPVKNSRLVILHLEDADPARAQRVLSALVEAYLEQNVEAALSSTNSAADWLRGQLDKLKGELESSELALHSYKKDRQILSVSIDDQSNMLREEMQLLNSEVTRVKTRKEGIASRRDELNKINHADPTDLPASELLNSGILQRLREDYLAAKGQRQALLGEGKGANHPTVKAADARIETTRTGLLAEVKNIKAALDKDYKATEREAQGLSRLFGSAKKRAMDLNLLEIEFRRLERTKNNNEKLYSLVLERTKESDLTRMLRFNNVRVIDQALLPRSAVKPNVPVNLGIGLFAGLFLGALFALSRELLDRSIKTPDDVEQEIGMTFLGLLPEMDEGSESKPAYGRRRRRAQAKGPAAGPSELVVHRDPMSGIAEAARAIRTNIMFMAPDRPYRRLLVTSAGPSEGKTTVACCIAIAMAQAGQRVLLLDCDLRRPRLHKIFGRRNDVGVTSAVLDRGVLDTVDLTTEVENLSVLPSGPHAPNPAELLHSESFLKLLDHVQERYDRVVLDSPPVVPVTDPAVLSNHVDGTVLVVRAFKTSRDLARQAARALRDVSANVVGCVLNAVDLNKRQYGYYQYYYYKRDGYGGREKEES